MSGMVYGYAAASVRVNVRHMVSTSRNVARDTLERGVHALRVRFEVIGPW